MFKMLENCKGPEKGILGEVFYSKENISIEPGETKKILLGVKIDENLLRENYIEFNKQLAKSLGVPIMHEECEKEDFENKFKTTHYIELKIMNCVTYEDFENLLSIPQHFALTDTNELYIIVYNTAVKKITDMLGWTSQTILIKKNYPIAYVQLLEQKNHLMMNYSNKIKINNNEAEILLSNSAVPLFLKEELVDSEFTLDRNNEQMKFILNEKKRMLLRFVSSEVVIYNIDKDFIEYQGADGANTVEAIDEFISSYSKYKIYDEIKLKESYVIGLEDGYEGESNTNPMTTYYQADGLLGKNDWVDQDEEIIDVPWKDASQMKSKDCRYKIRIIGISIEKNELDGNELVEDYVNTFCGDEDIDFNYSFNYKYELLKTKEDN